ncbi:hypothetical protein BKA69DRAFT_1111416 [Paraphysoderma sedebokerense]|nr:hypothetical protein BKA69DRAFT_1111416 [Paraphysoderma sedebokerense]
MKIKKTPPKKLAQPPAVLKTLIDTLTECSEKELSSHLSSIQEWTYPKSDLYQWIAVLNRFDKILEDYVKKFDFKHMQAIEMSSDEETLLIGILRLSRLLLENCSNRTLYSSFEHLNDLLCARNMDIVEQVLRLLLRPAQRLNAQKSIRSNFNISTEKLIALAQGFGTKQTSLSMLDLISENFEIPEELIALNYNFYRTSKPTTSGEAKEEKTTPKTPASQIQNSSSNLSEGLVHIQLPPETFKNLQSEDQLLRDLVLEYNIPYPVESTKLPESTSNASSTATAAAQGQNYVFSLAHKIRVSYNLIRGLNKRRQLLTIRILALCILVLVTSEEVLQTRVFVYDPSLISSLSDLIHPDKNAPWSLRVISLYTLEAIARHRSHLSEVLNALNASVSHGLFLQILRQTITGLGSDNVIIPQEFVDALLYLLSYFITLQSSGNTLINAGMVAILVEMIKVKSQGQLKNVAKVIQIIDSVTYGFTNGFNAFTNSGGLEILVERLHNDVQMCIDSIGLVSGQHAEIQTADNAGLSITAGRLTQETSSLLKSMLKFILHMMQVSGATDRLRNLIDTSVPIDLGKIFENARLFGSAVYSSAINVMATFIHNEPTSLSILQEMGLPTMFLESSLREIPAASDIMTALPNAFGAICLNSAGLAEFNKLSPMENFFSVFSSVEHVKAMNEGDVAALLGGGIDELIRHHPSLRDSIMTSVMTMLKRVRDICRDYVPPKDQEDIGLAVIEEDLEMAEVNSKVEDIDNKKDSLVCIYIDMAARFLEGIFSNPAHCRDFMKHEGIPLLIEFYSLPSLPHDFPSSQASYSLSHLFRILSDVNTPNVVDAIFIELTKQFSSSADILQPPKKLENGDYDSVFSPFVQIRQSEVDKLQQGNQLMRQMIVLHGLIGLLSDLISPVALPSNKSVQSIVQCSANAGKSIFANMAILHRICIRELILLRSHSAAKYFNEPKKSKNHGSLLDSWGVTSLDEDIIKDDKNQEGTSSSSNSLEASVANDRHASDSTASDMGPIGRNTRCFKSILFQISNCLLPLFLGLSKALLNRRTNDVAHRKNAFKVASFLATALKDYFEWSVFFGQSAVESVNRTVYLCNVFGIITLCLLDEKQQAVLQTVVLREFEAVGGMDLYLSALGSLWNDFTTMSMPSKTSPPAQIQYYISLRKAIDTAVAPLMYLVSSKFLNESPHTSSLLSRDKDKSDPDAFDPQMFLVKRRIKILKLSLKIWNSIYIYNSAPADIILEGAPTSSNRSTPLLTKYLISILHTILKAEGEASSRSSVQPADPTSFLSSLLPLTQPQANPERVNQLADMGFPRQAAEHALVRNGNNVARAAEYLLLHPEVVSRYDRTESTTTQNQTNSVEDSTTTDSLGGNQANSSGSDAADDDGDAEMTDQAPQLSNDGSEDIQRSVTSLLTSTVASSSSSSSTGPPAQQSSSLKTGGDTAKKMDSSYLDELNVLRDTLKAMIIPSSLSVLDSAEDVIFDIKELIVFLLKSESDMKNHLNIIVEDLFQRYSQSRAESVTADNMKSLAVRFRLLALLLNESSLQERLMLGITDRIAPLLSTISAEYLKPLQKCPDWVKSALLCIEAIVSFIDEPKQVPLCEVVDGEVKAPTAEKKDMKESILDIVTVGRKEQLLLDVLSLLSQQLDKDTKHSCLRVLSRLTRDFRLSSVLLNNNGVQLLLQNVGDSVFSGQQSLTVIILRHAIEDEEMLEYLMEKEVTSYLSGRTRLADVATFLKTKMHIALRWEKAFVSVVSRLCKIPKYEPFTRSQILALKDWAQKKGDTKEKEELSSSSSIQESGEGAKQLEQSLKPVPQSVFKSANADNIIRSLISELLALKSQSQSPSLESLEPVNSDSNLQVGLSDKDFPKKSATTSSSDTTSNPIHVKRCFILQLLSELTLSYVSCKTSAINFTRHRKGKEKEIGTPQKHRSSFVNHLVNDLIPWGGVYTSQDNNDPAIRKRLFESFWATSCLSSICSPGNLNAEEEKSCVDLDNVRRTVLDAVAKAFNAAITSAESIDVKYGRFLALSDLCFKFLSLTKPSMPLSRNNLQSLSEDVSVGLVRIMLEKNFVSLFTQALAEIDIHHPQSKVLVSAILKPMEMLTKMAIKMGKIIETKEDKVENVSYPSTPSRPEGLSSGGSEHNMQDAEDMVRTSALGILSGHHGENDESLDEMSEDEDMYDEEEGYDDLSEGDSDLSEDEVDDEEDDEHVDVVIRPPYPQNIADNDDESESDSEIEDDMDSEGDMEEHMEEEFSDGEHPDDWEMDDADDVEHGELLDLPDSGDHEEDLEETHNDEGEAEQIREDYDEEEEISEEDDEEEEEGDDDDEGGEENLDVGNYIPVGLRGLRRPPAALNGHPLFAEIELEGQDQLADLGGIRRRDPTNVFDEMDRLSRTMFENPFSTAPIGSSMEELNTHPLLSNRPALTHISSGRAGRTAVRSDWRTLEDLVGGGAMQILESLLSRAPRGRSYRIEVSDGQGGRFTQERLFDAAESGRIRIHSEALESSSLYDFKPLGTLERWHQEAKLMYGSSINEKSSRLVNQIVNALLPDSLHTEKLRKQKEEKEKQEQLAKETEAKQKAEEEKQLKEQLEKEKKEQEEQLSHISAGPTPAVESTMDSTATPAPSSMQRITVRVGGQEFDITNTGIDVEFLEALPEDLRLEVINQHLREQRLAQQVPEETQISPEFLEALPPEIREEVLAQERQEAERRQRQQAQPQQTAAAAPVEMDPASFLAALDPRLRQSVLMEQDEAFLASLPPDMVAEANAALRQPLNRETSRRPTSAISSAISSSMLMKKSSTTRESIQLVDKSNLATLVRLLFLPQPIAKNTLQKLLLNLSENSKSRVELMSMLLSILQDGASDLAAVDKSFSQMSIRSKGAPKTPKTPKSHSYTQLPLAPIGVEAVPNLVAQRCLETLSFLVNNNELSVNYFLTEQNETSLSKKSKSSKGKGKALTTKYPAVTLLSLLERHTFLSNPSLMEQLMQLLAVILRPLGSSRKCDLKEIRNASGSPSNRPLPAENMLALPSQETSSVSTPALVINEQTDAVPKADVSSDVKVKQSPSIKCPVIPDQYLRAIVNVLTSGECPIKTFQYTLNVMQYLSTVVSTREILMSELKIRSRALGDALLKDLDTLCSVMEIQCDTAVLDSPALDMFTSPSSGQAKFLRILKTIDYLYSKFTVINQAPGKPSVSSTEDANTSDLKATEESNLSSDGAGVPENISSVYDSLTLNPLWKRLSSCLTAVHDKPNLIQVATVLLPLIESFMVVSKPVTTSSSPQTPTRNADVDFFKFTEEHRKVLNTLVRNNPSLLSGSFSVLVHNPKVLEFDNKRNYFNQQLHKRMTRQHYPPVQLNIRRQYIFEDSFQQMQNRRGDEIKFGKLSIRFYEEEGVDAGGLTREWFSVLSRQIFNPDYALFKTSAADKITYQPNRASWINPEHLAYFKFVGRFIGKAIYDGRLLDCYFTRSFYKHILGKTVDLKDMEATDLEYYKSLEWILNNDITDVMDLSFSVDTDDFGKMKIVDLKPDGRNIPVTEENKQEYVQLIVEQKLTKAIKEQIDSFLNGFHDIIPPSLIRIFNEQELELLISGLPDIDVDDWKNNTEYVNYTASSPQIQWFWRAVRSFDQEERAKLVQFTTGTSKVPLEGFKALQGSNGVQKFQIHKDYSTNRLPSAHTCFNQLDLPAYESYEQLRSLLLKAVEEGSTGFGFA